MIVRRLFGTYVSANLSTIGNIEKTVVLDTTLPGYDAELGGNIILKNWLNRYDPISVTSPEEKTQKIDAKTIGNCLF